jgi:hypothetical protein
MDIELNIMDVLRIVSEDPTHIHAYKLLSNMHILWFPADFPLRNYTHEHFYFLHLLLKTQQKTTKKKIDG